VGRVSDHYTLRLPPGTTMRLERRAKRCGRPPRSLAQRYVEEGLRHDDHPLIHFVDGPSGRRSSMLGTGLDVWEIIATVRDNDNDPEAAAEYLTVPQGLVQAAIAYYGEFREEIDEEIALNHAEWEIGHARWQAGRRALEE
jgi:uncharacterized protein (DUF433 family)